MSRSLMNKIAIESVSDKLSICTTFGTTSIDFENNDNVKIISSSILGHRVNCSLC